MQCIINAEIIKKRKYVDNYFISCYDDFEVDDLGYYVDCHSVDLTNRKNVSHHRSLYIHEAT